ncbi:MAG: glucan 1,4-alpha-glucosidase [Isosphaeraceae bacterium]|nr:glucan 1,4-alpha-glucosidase [Isosphaeraceae bacterium]
MPRVSDRREEGFRRAALLGAGVIAAGGAAAWAWRRLSPHLLVAPGWPGARPRWNYSSKEGIGTAIDPSGRPTSQVWFTLRHGVLTEVFYPRVDRPAIRELGLIVTDGRGFYSEETEDARHELEDLAEGVPAYRLINTCHQGRYRIEKTIITHPRRDVVLQLVRFLPLRGSWEDYHLHAMVNPHLGNQGQSNTAWVAEHEGRPVLLAERAGQALALACSTGWAAASAGYVGASDGRRELRRYGRLTRTYDMAPKGNVALTGTVDLHAGAGTFLLALGFGPHADEAAEEAHAALREDFEALRAEYIGGWQTWQQGLDHPEPPEPDGRDLVRISTAVLKAHEDKENPGAIVASLSTPWGQARDDKELGRVGYHVVWPRDLCESAGGLLAAGAAADAKRALEYLRSTQQDDGHWPQNQWADGHPLWQGIQVGETALPILLLDLLRRQGALSPEDLSRFWPMVRNAVSYIAQMGPASQEDRWENASGFTPFTLSVLIAAKLIAAEQAAAQGEPHVAAFLRETADAWYASLDDWTYVRGTRLARRAGVEGYYLRIAPGDRRGEPAKHDDDMELWYRPGVEKDQPPARIVSPDALAYVRFGLRAPDDPRIINTIKVIDAILKVETPYGPAWHRYNHDGYGEKIDGSPFDGKRGHGRAWPLLTGERAHYELAAGRRDEAIRLLRAMEAFAGDGGLIPEQVWDTYDIPEQGLSFGRPSGSAMPLAWAHAEYLKLRRSLRDGRVFDTPPQTLRRYLVEKTVSPYRIWRLDHQRQALPAGTILRVEVREPAVIHWSADHGPNGREIPTRDSGLGVHYADLPTERLPSGSTIRFTISWAAGIRMDKWGLLAPKPFAVTVE